MNSKIEKVRIEFHNENYETALKYFDEVDGSDEHYRHVLLFKIACLMELERYDEALFIIESVLAEEGNDELLLYEKITCHIYLDEKQEAKDALKLLEKVVALDDKRMILNISKFHKMLGNNEDALKFCDMALAIDREFEDAIRDKSIIAASMGNWKMVDECADMLLKVASRDMDYVIVFILKLFSGKFRECYDIVKSMEVCSEEGVTELVKSALYTQLYEELGVDVYLAREIEVSIDEVILLLLDYKENHVSSGLIHNVHYEIK